MGIKHFRSGSITVMFTVVILCVSVFAVLTAVTAAQELRVSERYAQYVRMQTECENEGRRWLYSLSGEPGEVKEYSIETDSMQLDITAVITGDGPEILNWSCTARWEPDEGLALWR